MNLETNLVDFAKKIKDGIVDAGEDALKVAVFLATNQAEINGLASLTGSTGSKITSTASNLLSQVAAAVEAAGSAAGASGLNVALDAVVIADVRSIIADLKKI